MNGSNLAMFRQLGDRSGEGNALGNLGLLYAAQGKREDAKQAWQGALTRFPPGAPELQQVIEWLQSLDRPRPSLLRRLVTAMTVLAATLFLISNLFAGCWLVALVILLISVVVLLMLKAVRIVD